MGLGARGERRDAGTGGRYAMCIVCIGIGIVRGTGMAKARLSLSCCSSTAQWCISADIFAAGKQSYHVQCVV